MLRTICYTSYRFYLCWDGEFGRMLQEIDSEQNAVGSIARCAPPVNANVPCVAHHQNHPESDRTVQSERTVLEVMLGRSGRKVIERQQCDRDCKSRVDLNDVPVKVCREFQFLNVQAGIHLYRVPPKAECFRFILEARRGAERVPYSREKRIFRRGGGSNWYVGHSIP